MKNNFLLRWLGSSRALRSIRRLAAGLIARYYTNKGTAFLVFDYSRRQHPEAVNLIRRIKQEMEMLLADQEAFLIYELVKKTEKVPGELAEVGVYQGASAKIMRAASAKPLHLFDTFDGLPVLSAEDSEAQFQKGNFPAAYEQVAAYLSDCKKIYLYPGIFPLTAAPISNTKFSLVHCDVDIYESMRDCLEFFYPRLSRGGVMICHDYPAAVGVKKAIDEFFADKPEIILEPFATSQALIVKL